MFENRLKSGYLLPVLAVAYALFTALVMIDAGEPARPRWWLGERGPSPRGAADARAS